MTKQLNMAPSFSTRLPSISEEVNLWLLDLSKHSEYETNEISLLYRNLAISCFASSYFYGYIFALPN